MLHSRSGLHKMMKKEAEYEKQIHSFQLPYSLEFTPYETQFNERVIRFCKEEGNRKHLKISKVIIIGDIGVGKTSLVKRFCNNEFDPNYRATIGVDFEVERFDILGVPFNLQIWDTAGQERFKSLALSYYRGANVIVTVFDLGKINTLSNSKQWIVDALRENQNNLLPPYIFLVGNKLDTISLTAYDITQPQAVKMMKSFQAQAEYWPVSSKSGINVDALFKRIATLAFQASVLQEISSTPISKIEIGKFNISGKEISQRRIKSYCHTCHNR